jgi:hypothetical protein
MRSSADRAGAKSGSPPSSQARNTEASNIARRWPRSALSTIHPRPRDGLKAYNGNGSANQGCLRFARICAVRNGRSATRDQPSEQHKIKLWVPDRLGVAAPSPT